MAGYWTGFAMQADYVSVAAFVQFKRSPGPLLAASGCIRALILLTHCLSVQSMSAGTSKAQQWLWETCWRLLTSYI